MSNVSEFAPDQHTPNSPEAERSILGAILLDNNAFNEAAGQIDAADFSLDSHRRIFARMSALIGAGQPVDMITLIEELDRHKDLKPVGDVGYVSSLTEGVPDRPSIEHYVRIVKEKSQLRYLLNTARLTGERITSGERLSEVSASLLEAVLNVEAESGRTSTVSPRQFMPEVLANIQAQSGSSNLIGLDTGLDCLNDALGGGLRNGELVVIGARPGAGKTALATQMIVTCGAAGVPAGFFSLEMSRWDLGRRFLSAVTNVAAYQIRDPRWIKPVDPAWKALAQGAGACADWPIEIDDNGSLTIAEIMARAKLFISRKKARLIVVDYLQLVRAPISDIRERVGHVADQLRLLAKVEQIPVVLLSQLRRPERLNDEPSLLELKESGDIEAHAHVVLLIHSPVGPDMKPTDEQKIIVAKNRNGVRGQELVTLNPAKLLFYPRTR